MINNPIIYKLFRDFTNHRKTNRVVVFSSSPFLNVLKYRDLRLNLPTIWKTRLLKAIVEEFSYYVILIITNKFQLTVL